MSEINTKLLWIHCNRCFEIYVEKKRIFFLLACKHVLCEKCTTQNVGPTPDDSGCYKCPFCKKSCRGREIGNGMPANLKDLFHPEPWRDGINHQTVHSFQKLHQEHFQKHFLKEEQAIQDIEAATKREHENCRKLYLELEQLRLERKQLEHRVMQVKRQRQREEEELQAKKRHTSAMLPPPPPPSSSTNDSFQIPNGPIGNRPRYKRAKSVHNIPVSLCKQFYQQSLGPPTRMPNPSTQHNITSFMHLPNKSFDL